MATDLDLLAYTYEREPDSEYFPIPVSSICHDSISKFDLYLNVRPDEPLVLYAQRGNELTEEGLSVLHDGNLQQLHIPSDQVEDYRQYIEENLGGILQNPTASASQKAQILYTCSSHVVKRLFDDPHREASFQRGKEMVHQTIEYMLTHNSALRYILEIASSDYTAFTHSLNGTYLSIALAQKVGIVHPVELRKLGFGALLRDIGMTQIDAEIIEKRGRLEMSEFRQIKQHPILGEKMARNFGIIGETERLIIRQHHERLDGSGYTEGLKGDDISILVRVVSIADVFNALNTDRPYQPRMTSFDALKYMSANMRDELDVNIFGTFVGMMGKTT